MTARSTALRWLQAQRCRVREGARQPFLLTDDFTSELGVNVNMNVFWRSGLNLNMYPSYGPLMMTRAFSCAYVTRNGSVENNFMIHCEQFRRMCVWCYLCSFRVCSGMLMLMLMLLCLHALKTFQFKKNIYQDYGAYTFVAIDARGNTEPMERWWLWLVYINLACWDWTLLGLCKAMGEERTERGKKFHLQVQGELYLMHSKQGWSSSFHNEQLASSLFYLSTLSLPSTTRLPPTVSPYHLSFVRLSWFMYF